MTSRRRHVIEIGHHFYFLPCALVQSIIPPNLVKISQQTKKFIGLQILWWGGWGVVGGVIKRCFLYTTTWRCSVFLTAALIV